MAVAEVELVEVDEDTCVEVGYAMLKYAYDNRLNGLEILEACANVAGFVLGKACGECRHEAREQFLAKLDVMTNKTADFRARKNAAKH